MVHHNTLIEIHGDYLDNFSVNWVIRDPIKVFSSYYISLTFKFQYLYISLSIGSQTLDHYYHIGCNGSEITRIHDVWKRS